MNRITILFFFCFIISAKAQFLNNSFEEWDSTCIIGSFTPVDWAISGDVTRNLNAYEGNYAVHLQVSEISGNLESPELITNQCGTFVTSHPITERFEKVKGYYKFSPQSNDLLFIGVSMLASDGISQIGVGFKIIGQQTSQWTEFVVDIIYSEPDVPSYITTRVLITDFQNNIPGHLGSMADVDLFSLENPTEVKTFDDNSLNYELFYNFPNPFNPSTKIKYTITKLSKVQIKIFDALGSEIETLINKEKPAGAYEITWNAANLPSGVYFYQLRATPGGRQAGDHSTGSGQVFVQTGKMILLK